MKGYLKNQDGLFQLAPKVTTIGREGCDLVIQSSGVDYQHAVLEYSPEDNCFVLQDLNSTHGTFVNDCRVQNAAVRLASGDVLRFGNSAAIYELLTDESDQFTYPPLQSHTGWTQPSITLLQNSPAMTSQYTPQESLPHLQSVIRTSVSAWGSAPAQTTMPPRPPPPSTIRSRPLSAGSVGMRRVTGGITAAVAATNSPPTQHRGLPTQNGSGWIAKTPQTNRGFNQQNDIMLIQDKMSHDFRSRNEEQKILRLQEELKRTQMFEVEVQRKEELIQTLREEVADLQGKLRHLETTGSNFEDGRHLEKELTLKRSEVQSLKEQIMQMRLSPENGDQAVGRQEYNERVKELNSLRTEIERVRKDKNITSGLFTQLQRDMGNKDTTISRLTREIESLKSSVQDKDTQLLALQGKLNRQIKFRKAEESKKTHIETDVKDRELAALKLKSQASENRLQEQTSIINSLKEELEKMKKEATAEKDVEKKLSSELEAVKHKSTDLERAERLVRVDLEQLSKKLERFRSRVIMHTFSTPGIKAPSTEIEDDELLSTLKQVIDERTELLRKSQDLKQSLNASKNAQKDIVDNTKKLKSQLADSLGRLKIKGIRVSQLKQETDLLKCVTVDEQFDWLKDGLVEYFSLVQAWQEDTDSALVECGINVQISDEKPSHHIHHLRVRGKELMAEKLSLIDQLASAEERHRADNEKALEDLRQELTNKSADDMERIKIESEEKMNRMIDEIRELENEKRETAIEAEKEKVTTLEASLAELKQSLLSKEEENQTAIENVRKTHEQVETYKEIESKLQEEISQLSQKLEEATSTQSHEQQAELAKYQSTEMHLKDQIKQHAVTICSMEERLNKVVKKNKDYQAEIAQLKHSLAEVKAKPPVPHTAAKPKVIVQKPAADVVAMETTIAELRRDNVSLKTEVADSKNVIIGLRRDLAGASARLTDITGELSEAQKEELERHKGAVKSKEIELLEIRQQMVQLTKIVDKKTEDIKLQEAEMNKLKGIIQKYKNMTNEKDNKVREIEEQLSKEQQEQKKKLDIMNEEGRITSELSSLGAQCRGERHEQVITRQREALTELRHRIRALEQLRPQDGSNPMLPNSLASAVANFDAPSTEHALQQVVLLKKELAEMKAAEAARSTGLPINTAILQEQVSKARGIENSVQDRSELEVERSSHRETIDTLDQSEESYLNLLRSIAMILDLDTISGLRPMSHLPRDERATLVFERGQACETLAGRIKVLKERITRKDELLQGYEKDLAKLRQAEVLAEQRGVQVESLSNDIRSRTEETQYLRESLHRTRDKMEQEKRLNSAIKSKKTFHLENEKPVSKSFKSPHCEVEDVMGKADQKKKQQIEKLRRKNYEIRVLKEELTQRDHSLSDTSRRLLALENQVGLEPAQDMLPVPRY